MKRIFPLACALFCLSIPLAHAESIDVWDFTQGQHMADGAQELTSVTKDAQGIHVNTTTDGFLFWNTPFTEPVDVIVLHIATEKAFDGAILWQAKSGEQMTHYVHVRQGAQGIDVAIPTDDLPSWNWTTQQVAFGFPAGTNMILSAISLHRFSTMEKVTNAFQSFWTFDDFRAYSINFLWGPLLAFNPISRIHLFDEMPPPSWSADRLFYLVIIASIIIGLIFYVYDRTRGKPIALRIIGITFVCVWLLFDARMGSEILSYAVNDYTMYIAPPTAQKTFRTHGTFYTRAEAMLPTIRKYPNFVLYAPDPSPYYSNLRYMAYPSVAWKPQDPHPDAKLIVVMDRPDIKVDAQHRLVDAQGTVLAATGSIIGTTDDRSFLFATP